jgi:hypothetical protein
MEVESVADYDVATVELLKWTSQHDYLLHILALKKRSDRAKQHESLDQSGW